MALATCTVAGLAEAGACFTSPQLSSHQRKAMIVYLLNQIGAALGAAGIGNDFNALLSDSICLQQLKPDQREAAIVGILNGSIISNNGWVNVGDSLETLTVAQLVEGAKCLYNFTDEQLELMTIRLICVIFGAQVGLA